MHQILTVIFRPTITRVLYSFSEVNKKKLLRLRRLTKSSRAGFYAKPRSVIRIYINCIYRFVIIIGGGVLVYSQDKHQEIIENSHQRCEKYLLNRNFVDHNIPLSREELKTKLEINKEFIELAIPFINNLHEFLNDTGYCIMLSDRDGCILYIKGTEEDIRTAYENHIEVGMYKDEKTAGTNGIGTALFEDLPVQINGSEHYLYYHHLWSCTGAPIHDVAGNIIGCLNITAKVGKVHNHTLGLVVAAVSAIENEMKVKKAHDELYFAYSQVHKLVGSIKAGIIAVDIFGNIRQANNYMYKILNGNDKKIENKKIAEIIENWDEIFAECIKHNGKLNQEIYLRGKPNRRYNCEIYGIEDQEGIVREYMVIIEEIDKVYSLVSKYSGFDAKYSFDNITDKSEIMKKLKEDARKVADSETTVLIQGESGTGKELFAHSIHNASSRRHHPFIAINCAAIPKSLIESELFGYEEGSFTGASKKGHPGKFELANGGTIFLDEIGEMPLDMQAKLLRVIQDRSVVRIGGTRKNYVDIRIIAATNKDLRTEIKMNSFRADLFYRLNVFSLIIPPLRERIDDVEPLVVCFVNKFSSRFNKKVVQVDQDVIRILESYYWPGNIRELENVIERIFNEIEDSRITYSCLPKHIIENYEQVFKNLEIKNNKLLNSEMREINNALRSTKGNIKESARILGIGRSTLYRKLKKYDIDYENFRRC